MYAVLSADGVADRAGDAQTPTAQTIRVPSTRAFLRPALSTQPRVCCTPRRVVSAIPSYRRHDVTLACAAITLALGALVLVGWAFDIGVLKSLSPAFITMKANTAVGLMSIAMSILAVRIGYHGASRLFASLAAVIALLTLSEYLSRWNAGIDELLFPDPGGAGGRFPPGRLAPITAVSFLLLSCAVWAAGVPGPLGSRVSQAATLIASMIALQAMLGYAFGITYNFGSAFYTQIALHTAALLVVLCIGILALRPHEGLVAIFLAHTQGGEIARRLIATAIFMPPLVNYLQILGQRAGLFDADFGVLLRVVGNVVLFSAIVWHSASALHRSDLARLDSEAALRMLNTELEQRVEQRTQELSRANSELEAFSYSVSHDLRAPLRAVAGFTQALEEECGGSLSEQGKEYLARTHVAALRMGKLIDGLLDLARLGHAAMHVERVDISSMAREILRELHQHEPERGVECVVAEGIFANADAQLIRVVLDNLLRNAWKFTGGVQKPRIELGQNPAGAYYVKDNGTGFDMAYTARLFGAFRRLHSDSEFPGTGVGLATVKRVVRLHNGEVRAEAAPGRGATFFFTLEG